MSLPPWAALVVELDGRTAGGRGGVGSFFLVVGHQWPLGVWTTRTQVCTYVQLRDNSYKRAFTTMTAFLQNYVLHNYYNNAIRTDIIHPILVVFEVCVCAWSVLPFGHSTRWLSVVSLSHSFIPKKIWQLAWATGHFYRWTIYSCGFSRLRTELKWTQQRRTKRAEKNKKGC